MSVSLKANSAGTQGEILLNGTTINTVNPTGLRASTTQDTDASALTRKDYVDKVAGVGRTWQQPGRDLGIIYTNNTGRDIVVNFSGVINAPAFRFLFQVNGTAIAYSSVSTVANEVLTMSGIVVPNGATYLITQNGGTPAIDFWSELR